MDLMDVGFQGHDMSNEKNRGWLGYIGDEKLPNWNAIIINQYKDPY